MRRLLLVALIGMMAVGLAGCGRKAAPKFPPDATYPSEYPAPAR